MLLTIICIKQYTKHNHENKQKDKYFVEGVITWQSHVSSNLINDLSSVFLRLYLFDT